MICHAEIIERYVNGVWGTYQGTLVRCNPGFDWIRPDTVPHRIGVPGTRGAFPASRRHSSRYTRSTCPSSGSSRQLEYHMHLTPAISMLKMIGAGISGPLTPLKYLLGTSK